MCLRNKYLTETNRAEVYRSCKTSCKPTHNTKPLDIMKQGNNVRDHSLNLPQFITIPRLRLGIVNIEIWTTPSLRGEVVRNYRNSAIVQSLDSNKSRLITRRNTTLINYQSLMSGNLIRKCYYSSSSEVIERLENSKRELEAVLAHKLRQNVLDYKRDNKTV